MTTSHTLPEAVDPTRRQLRVLYADDMLQLRELIAIVLNQDGHTVETAATGVEALEKITSTPARYDVVITDGCHFPEVKDAGAGEVVAIAAPAVAQALMRVLDDPKGRERMGAAGRKLVEDRFTWRRAAERCIEVYGQIIR